MKATRFFFCLLLALLPLAAPAAFTISVSPSSIAWDSNTWVSVRITNDTVSGYAANLTFFVDPDSNSAVGPEDVPLMNFMLRDGRTNSFGAVTIPDDDDGITNGAVLTRIPVFGIDNPLHMIGSYVVQVAFTDGTSPAVTPFTVTQPTTTVYITGRVVNYAHTNIPVAAAYLNVYPFAVAVGFPPSVWTDTNGAFRIYLPPSMTGNVDAIVAGALGYFSAPNREETGEWISGYRFTNDLEIGENMLTNDLKVIPAIPGFLHTVSGRVIDDSSNAIPYALVTFEEESDDSDVGADAIADTNGYFELPIPDGMTGGVGAEGAMLNLRGFVSSGVGPFTVTQDLPGLVITCPAATILAQSRIVDVTSGDGVEGIGMSFDSDGYWSAATSVTGGLYEIGLVSNTYGTDVNDDSFQPLGYAAASSYKDLGVTNSGIYTNAPLYLTRGYVVSGTVFDRNTNPLTGGEVQIAPFEGSGGNGCDVNRHGSYFIVAATGTYRTTARDFEGYLEQVYSNHFTWEWDEGPVADPVTVTTNGATNINFFLTQASYIRGTVFGTNAPLADAFVSVNAGENGRGGTHTDLDGTYEFSVLAGTNYTVRAQGPDDGFFLYQYWSNATDDSEADLVSTDTNAPAENINFNLQLGGRIEGAMYETDGTTFLTNANGHVEARTTNDDWVCGGDVSQDSGTYGFAIAAGVYHVRGEANNWLVQYYDRLYENNRNQANLVTVEVSQVTGGIDFTMQPPSYVRGNVHSGAILISNAHVEVRILADTNNPWQTDYVNQENSAADGNYSVPVPPGTNYVVVAHPEGGSYYVEQWWSNAPNSTQASLLDLGEEESATNIDFDMELGMRIEGQVLGENGDPMNAIWVNALCANTNGGYDNAASAETDSSGCYGFSLSATTSYVVCVQRPWNVGFSDWWYPGTYYSDAFSVFKADRIRTNAGETVGGVDFHMMLGYRVEGFVTTSDGSTPAPGGWMQGRDSLDEYVTGDNTDDGWYEVILPTNQALYAIGGGEDLQSEYYDNVLHLTNATALQAPAMTTVRVDFALYDYHEDHDGDGVPDQQEDTRPDGIYNPGEDWASYTNIDTDLDFIADNDELSWDISPKLADTDGDTFSDYQEVYVTCTDPHATPSGSNSYLHCLQTTRLGSNVVLKWSAIEYAANYYVQRSTNLMSELWDNLAGPMTGTGSVMTVTDSNAPPNATYRVRIPYTP